jgi:hypothetical protein
LPRIDWQTALKGLAGFVVAVAIWAGVSPLYDRVVAAGAEMSLRTFESPKVTHLTATGTDVKVDRSDFDPRSPRPGLPVIDLTFNWVLLAALFAINPRPFSDRNMLRFAIASVLMYFTHVLALVTEVMSIYVLRLGAWSGVHYGAFARNFWGVANHSYRFVLMFAIAFGLWWALRPTTTEAVPASRSPRKASRRRARS